MPLTGIDESVKQAILQRNTFENIDLVSSVTTLRSRRGSHVVGASFYASNPAASPGTTSPGMIPSTGVNNTGSRRQSRVQFTELPKDTQTLDLPGTSSAVPGGSLPV